MACSCLKALITESLVEYPGHVTAVAFTGACNLTCPWCYNQELKTAKGISWKQEFKKLKNSVIDAITFTGGEPLMAAPLNKWIDDAKREGLLVQIETNGMFPERLEELIDMIDRVAIDFKLPLARYPEIHGEGEKLIQSINLAKNSGIDYEIRTTLPCEKNFITPEDLAIIEEEVDDDKHWVIQYYLNDPVDKWLSQLRNPWHTYTMRH